MNPTDLNRELVSQIDHVVQHLLPNGKREGREWRVGSVNGDKGKSCSICMEGPKAGLWRDFADNKNPAGSDLLGLWGAVTGLSFVDTLKDAALFAGVSYEPQKKLVSRKTYRKPSKPKCGHVSTWSAWFEGRGLSEETVRAFMVGEKEGAIVFPSMSPSGELELVKYRGKDKKIWSNKDPIPCLFGWQTITDDDRFVVITEGELDAMTYFQAGIPALSVPKGGGGGEKQSWIEYEYDRLERFEEIYLSMDADEAGEEALKAILDRLGRDRCKVVELPLKDANETHCWLSGYDFGQAVQDAKSIDPDELRQLADFHGDIMDVFYPRPGSDKGMKLPWSKAKQAITFRPGEVSLWAGVNSHGKSVALSHVAVDGVAQGYKFCIASMEMTPARLGEKMYQQVGAVHRPGKDFGAKIRDFLADNIWIFNVIGRAKAERILSVFDYARKRYGVKHFVIDSLAKCGIREDDYSRQKEFVDELMEYARTHMVHVHLVLHMRKREHEGSMAGKMDIKGSGGISDMADNIFVVWRNKAKELAMSGSDEKKIQKYQDKPDAAIKCEKQKVTGEEPYYGLWFDRGSCQYLERDGEAPKQYIL